MDERTKERTVRYIDGEMGGLLGRSIAGWVSRWMEGRTRDPHIPRSL